MGGNAFSDVGVIHRCEITPTLSYLSKVIGVENIDNFLFGSAGKKEISGDIDIVLPEELISGESLHKKLIECFGKESVKKHGSSLTASIPIPKHGCAVSFETDAKRTGKVQVDFVIGDPDWTKFFYHSSENSKYKGVHRNIAISTLAGACDYNEVSNYLDDYGRPLVFYRYKWSPKDGLVRVRRESVFNRVTGKYNKSLRETIVGEKFYSPEKIAAILFKHELGPEYLDSLETVVYAINKIYKNKEDVFRQMAFNLTSQHRLKKENWIYPYEIQKYIDQEDDNENQL